jgi:hypothetical protein
MKLFRRLSDKARVLRGWVTYYSGTKHTHHGLNHYKVDDLTFACGCAPDLLSVVDLSMNCHREGERVYPNCKRCEKKVGEEK